MEEVEVDTDTDVDSDATLDADDIRKATGHDEAHEYILGEEDYDPDKMFNLSPYVRTKWKQFKRRRLIDLGLYTIVRKEGLREDSSEILLHICKSKFVI